MGGLKEVRAYWESRSPGLKHSPHEVGTEEFFNDVERERYGDVFKYQYLTEVAEFDLHRGHAVLEVGVGLGTDILQFARNGAIAHGIDITSRAVEVTAGRFRLDGRRGHFGQGSFTDIPFRDGEFDLVYSFGVLHHSEETQEGIDEIFRVLKPGGRVIVMVYHKGFKYYVRKLFVYGILRGELLSRSAQEIVSRHSEDFGDAPLTKAFSRSQARRMFDAFEGLTLDCYRLDDYVIVWGAPVSPARTILPYGLYRRVENRFGWNLIIKGRKPG